MTWIDLIEKNGFTISSIKLIKFLTKENRSNFNIMIF